MSTKKILFLIFIASFAIGFQNSVVAQITTATINGTVESKSGTEDLVAAAINDAVHKVEQATKDKYAGITDGIPLPPGMKLPF